MKHLFAMFAIFLCGWIPATAATKYEMALPGYKFSFPADHASHDRYKTEWWYYTGHLAADDGTKYGYELTFFGSAMDVSSPTKSSTWSVKNVYLTHFAVSDISKQKFFYDERLNRAGVGLAGAESANYKVWNQDWKAELDGNVQHLQARSADYDLDLSLTSEKPPVIHGQNGVSQKASCVGCASHYYSFTRLNTEGTMRVRGKLLKVKGISWMDHEFGSNQLTKDQVGWDWFSIQLDNNQELMLYNMRLRTGRLDPNSSGTFVSADGSSEHLKLSDYKIRSTGSWRSPGGTSYPMGWHVSVPKLHMELDIASDMPNQELAKRRTSDVGYWEGASSVTGNINGKSITGQAYVEMTGYSEKFNAGI